MFRSLIFALALVFATVTAAQAATNVAIAPLMQVAEKSKLQDQAADLSDSARQQKGQELEKEARALESRRQEFTKKAAPIEQKINQQILEILSQACANYAKNNGFDIILDSGAVLYASSAANIEEGLVDEVNKIWKDKGSKFKL